MGGPKEVSGVSKGRNAEGQEGIPLGTSVDIINRKRRHCLWGLKSHQVLVFVKNTGNVL